MCVRCFGVKMQRITNPVAKPVPKTGYYIDKEKIKEEHAKNESHIPQKQGFLTNAKVYAHKLTNDVVTYFPKGFQGSKNSDFYEYLSMGIVPNLIGSFMLIYTSCGANKFFNAQDSASASKGAKMMGMGVVLFALGKWLHSKISNFGVKKSTDINLEQKYINKNAELPENGEKQGIVREQKPGVYDSVTFFRDDLLAYDGELNHGSRYYYKDKIAKKAGIDKPLNSPDQEINKRIRGVKARTTALQNIGKYIVAATCVALGSQEAFGEINFRSLKSIKNSFKKGFKQFLGEGKDRSFIHKHAGKALLGLSVVSTLLSWLIPVIAFKQKPDTLKTQLDPNKETEVC